MEVATLGAETTVVVDSGAMEVATLGAETTVVVDSGAMEVATLGEETTVLVGAVGSAFVVPNIPPIFLLILFDLFLCFCVIH
jgi:hypothetical protein